MNTSKTKTIIIIEADTTFIQKFQAKIREQFIDDEYDLCQVIPDITIRKTDMFNGCISNIKTKLDTKNVEGVFVDINLSENDKDTMGIELALKLREQLPSLLIFPITQKHSREYDFDNISDATLEKFDGVFVKSYLIGADFSAERLKKIFLKARQKKTSETITNEIKILQKTYDIAVVTALTLEFDELKKILDAPIKKINRSELAFDDSTSYYSSTITNKFDSKLTVVIATEDRMGMTTTASLCTRMLIHFQPKLFAMLGIAAGIEGSTNIGDILIPQFSYDYGSGKIDQKKLAETEKEIDVFKPYTDPIPLDEKLRDIIIPYSNDPCLKKIGEAFVDFVDKQSPSLHIGPFGSGAAVIANSNIIEQLTGYQGKIIGFDMEVFGLFSAVRKFDFCKAIAIKSVSDFGNKNKNNSHKKIHQQYAAYTSAAFFKEFVIKSIPFELL